MTTYTQLLTLIAAATRALPVAQADTTKPPHLQRLFASPEGLALVEAAYELFDENLWDLLANVRRETGAEWMEAAE